MNVQQSEIKCIIENVDFMLIFSLTDISQLSNDDKGRGGWQPLSLSGTYEITIVEDRDIPMLQWTNTLLEASSERARL